jgi:hypothetical protein
VYGLKSCFAIINNKQVLLVGTQYSGTLGQAVNYRLNKNVISNDLRYVRKEDNLVKVQVTSLQPDGSRIEAAFKGDNQGDSKTFSTPGLTQAQCEEYARRLYEQHKTDRLDGSLTAFGVPFALKGARLNITAADGEVEDGSYIADDVNVIFGINGYRRVITPGPKLTI